MDRTFDEALRVLAEHQLRHGIRTLVLSVHEPSGDVVASVLHAGSVFCCPLRTCRSGNEFNNPLSHSIQLDVTPRVFSNSSRGCRPVWMQINEDGWTGVAIA